MTERAINLDISDGTKVPRRTEGIVAFSVVRRPPKVPVTSPVSPAREVTTIILLEYAVHEFISCSRQTRSFPRYARFVGSAHTKELSNSERERERRDKAGTSVSLALYRIRHSPPVAEIRRLIYGSPISALSGREEYAFLFFSGRGDDRTSGETGRMYTVNMNDIFFVQSHKLTFACWLSSAPLLSPCLSNTAKRF